MKFLRQFALLALAIGSGLLLAGCEPKSSKAPLVGTLSSLSVSPATLALAKGSAHPLTVSGAYTDGKSYDLTSGSTFLSSDGTVATVTGGGVVTAVNGGTATITATHTASGKSGTSVITVPADPVVSIAVTPLTATLAIGATQALHVTGTLTDGTTAAITTTAVFSTSDSNIATVSATGVVTAVKGGTVLITVTDTASGKTTAAAITVSVGAQYTVLDFNTAGLTYVLTPFGNFEVSTLTATGVPPNGALNRVVKIVKGAGGDCWAGTTMSVGAKASIGSLPFSASATSVTVQIYVPIANLTIKLKVEDANNAGVSVETDVLATAAGWQTLTFDFAKQAAGTAALDPTKTYNKMSIFSGWTCNGTGSDPGSNAFYVGPIVFLGASGPAAPPLPLATLASIAITAPASPIALTAGGTQSLTVTGTYSDTTTAVLSSGLTFQSDATGFATVTNAGLVTAVAAGTAHITATDTASGKVSPAVTVNVTGGASGGTNGKVFTAGALDTGVTFFDFGGATNVPAPAVDPATTFTDGTAAMKVVITGAAGAYSGGAWVASAPRDLRSFNALTFWAKSTAAHSTLKVQLGNDAGTGANVDFQVEEIGLGLTATWQQFVIPLPDPTQANGIDGLFSFASANDNYTFWVANVQYANVPVGQLGTGFVAGDGFNGVPQPLSIPVGGTYAINPGPNSIVWTLPAGSPFAPLPNGGNLNNDGWHWFKFSGSNNAVASINANGVITGNAAGGPATFTATMAGVQIPGQTAVTVTSPLAVPATIAPTPLVSPANVIALFSSTYSNVPVDTWRTSWSANNNELVDPYTIAGHAVKQYTLHSFVGIEFGLNGVNTAVDASTMTTFHVDIWSPNPATDMDIQLVNDAAGAAAVGHFHTGALAANTWVSLEIPLSGFTGLTLRNKVNQLLFVPVAPSVIYIDNVYFHK